MAFITRLARLLRADLHALLDHLEEPELVLAQAIREMEQALDQERRRSSRLSREIERFATQESDLRRVIAHAGESLEDCLAAGDEALARPVIQRRLETERQLAVIARRRGDIESEHGLLERRLADRSARLTELRARAALYENEGGADEDDRVDLADYRQPAIHETDVEVALLRAKRLREVKV
jgi:phage shock protein A